MDYTLICLSPFFLPARDICHGAESLGTWRSLCSGVCVRQLWVVVSLQWWGNGIVEMGGIKNFIQIQTAATSYTGHNISAGHVHTRVVQFSNERHGSKLDLECKVVQDEKWNINDWCGYQWNTFFSVKMFFLCFVCLSHWISRMHIHKYIMKMGSLNYVRREKSKILI